MNTLDGQVVIVTVAGSGTGKATALLAAREGAAVVIADQNAESGATSNDEIRAAGGLATFVETDVADDTSVAAMVERTLDVFGRIDSLVNNAGTDIEGPTTTFRTETWKRVIDVNLAGTSPVWPLVTLRSA